MQLHFDLSYLLTRNINFMRIEKALFLFISVLIFMLSSSCFCQSIDIDNSKAPYKHDISGTYGIMTKWLYSERYGPIPLIYERYNIRSTHGIFVAYKYSVSQKLRIGCAAGYEGISSDYYHFSDHSLAYRNKSRFFSIAFESDVKYLQINQFQVYSGFGIGAALINHYIDNPTIPDNTIHENRFNYHLLVAGFRIGKEICPFIELGYGYKGLINAGLSYRF